MLNTHTFLNISVYFHFNFHQCSITSHVGFLTGKCAVDANSAVVGCCGNISTNHYRDSRCFSAGLGENLVNLYKGYVERHWFLSSDENFWVNSSMKFWVSPTIKFALSAENRYFLNEVNPPKQDSANIDKIFTNAWWRYLHSGKTLS